MENITIIKYTVAIATFPLWSKILKLLWDDMRDAMREEGGLWGPDPHPRRIEEIRREHAAKDEILVHEPRNAGSRGFDRARAKAPGSGQGPVNASGKASGKPGRAAAPLRRAERSFGRRPR